MITYNIFRVDGTALAEGLCEGLLQTLATALIK